MPVCSENSKPLDHTVCALLTIPKHGKVISFQKHIIHCSPKVRSAYYWYKENAHYFNKKYEKQSSRGVTGRNFCHTVVCFTFLLRTSIALDAPHHVNELVCALAETSAIAWSGTFPEIWGLSSPSSHHDIIPQRSVQTQIYWPL